LSNPSDDDDGIQIPLDIICYDPQNRSQPCPLCSGKGVVYYDVPVGDPKYGKLNRCQNNPVEFDSGRQERLRHIGNLDVHKGKSFENFITNPPGSEYTSSIIESLNYALRSAVGFAESPKGWLVLEGTYGCGKTHLAVAIGNTRVEQFGDEVLFMTAPDLLDFLRTTFGANSEITYDESFNRIRNMPILILDDLGVENPSGWAKEKLFQLLNYRYSAELPTVITTNVELEELDPRLSSRMMESQIVSHLKILAPDYRPSIAKRSDLIFSQLNLYEHMTFETFDVQSQYPDEQENLKNVSNYAYAFTQRPQGWIAFTGIFGAGKTHLAASISNELHSRGHQVMFTTVPELMDYMRVTFDPNTNVRFDKRFQEIKDAPILVLDDLSLESATSWAKEKLFQIIDHRYIKKMPTIFTTAIKSAELDPRLKTRLTDTRLCEIIAIKAPSYVDRRRRPS
jgi:DNA replication protein DnaC